MPQQPKKMMMKPYKKMGTITDKERNILQKIDYSGDFDRELAKFEKVVTPKSKFDKELAKFEKIAVPKAKGMDKTGYGPKIYDVRPKSSRKQKARDMMRTSKPEVRETKKDMVRRKKKELGIVGILTESDLKTMKRSMSANERKMLSSK